MTTATKINCLKISNKLRNPAIIFSDTKDGNAGPNVYTPYVSTPDCLMTDGELECVTYVG